LKKKKRDFSVNTEIFFKDKNRDLPRFTEKKIKILPRFPPKTSFKSTLTLLAHQHFKHKKRATLRCSSRYVQELEQENKDMDEDGEEFVAQKT
jgi:hypothetical protein